MGIDRSKYPDAYWEDGELWFADDPRGIKRAKYMWAEHPERIAREKAAQCGLRVPPISGVWSDGRPFGPIGRAQSLRRSLDFAGLSPQEFAKFAKTSSSSVRRLLALLDLSDRLQSYVEYNKIPPSTAIEIGRRPPEEEAILINCVLAGRLCREDIRQVRIVRYDDNLYSITYPGRYSGVTGNGSIRPEDEAAAIGASPEAATPDDPIDSGQTSAADPIITAEPCPISLQGSGLPFTVFGREHARLSGARYRALSILVDAYPWRVSKKELEKHPSQGGAGSGARKALMAVKGLHPDLDSLIDMAESAHKGYGIVIPPPSAPTLSHSFPTLFHSFSDPSEGNPPITDGTLGLAEGAGKPGAPKKRGGRAGA